MFKWAALAVGTLGLGAFLWMVNDMRMQVRQISERVTPKVPAILDGAETTIKTVNERLPDIITKTELTVNTLAEISDDLKQFKEFMGTLNIRDINNESARKMAGRITASLDILETLDATVGVPGEGNTLKMVKSAKEWVSAARHDIPFLSVFGKSDDHVVRQLTTTRTGQPWHIQLKNEKSKSLREWLQQQGKKPAK